MHSEYTRDQETSFGGKNEDIPRLERNILVAGNEERDSPIRGTMPTMSTSQSRAPKASGTTTIVTDIGIKMEAHYYEFYCRITKLSTGM